MNEEFLAFAWNYNLYQSTDLRTSDGESIRVESVGIRNDHAGPDFFQAKIRIGETLWAGNVEIHTHASDWNRHGHQRDPAYDNVILHVVFRNDVPVHTTTGRAIPALALDELLNLDVYDKYQQFLRSKSWVPCERQLESMDQLTLRSWLDRLMIQRLERKTQEILQALDQRQYDWAEVFYIFLARNFGFKVNADPFERLARSLPWRTLAKHRDNIHQVEALLFGQSGLLPADPEDAYSDLLATEYRHLKQKFSLEPLQQSVWRFMRMRPSNFPTVRLAQFAGLIHHTEGWFAQMLELRSVEEFRAMFQPPVTEYWNTHYRFGKSAAKRSRLLGAGSIDILLINTVVPFLFIYGRQKGQPAYEERAINLLERLNAEQNTIVKKWGERGVKAMSALDSQALLELKANYCNEKKCLICSIGNRILRSPDD